MLKNFLEQIKKILLVFTDNFVTPENTRKTLIKNWLRKTRQCQKTGYLILCDF